MRVLLTGGAGFIGRHVLRELLSKGHDVRVLDSLRADVHDGGKTAPLDGAELIVADVRDPAAIDKALQGVEAVLHLAAKVGLGVDVSDLPDYASSNDVGTAELAGRHGARRYQASDAGEFDGGLRRRLRNLSAARRGAAGAARGS